MDYKLVLETLYADKAWTLTGNEYAGLEWLDESSKPMDKTLQAGYEKAVYIDACNKVTRDRQIAYQLESDPIYMEAQRDNSRTIDEWKTKVDEIKARYPYPEKPPVE